VCEPDTLNPHDFQVLLTEMIEEVATSDPIYQPSILWEHLNALNLDQIGRLGLTNFKRSVNQNYFNWLPARLSDNQVKRVFREWTRRPTLAPLFARMRRPVIVEGFAHDQPLSTARSRFIYKTFVAALWDLVKRTDRLGLLDRLEEPILGNPIRIRHRHRLISQDLANSVRETYRLLDHLPRALDEKVTFAELGAGYGRLGFVLLHATPCAYWVFDIPPALLISQWYLETLFPNRRVFRFRPFHHYEAIREELEQSDIAFFSANQISKLPPQCVDAFVNISSLHEMRRAQASNFIYQMERVTRRVIYLKQWLDFTNTADETRVVRADYELSADWRVVYDAPDRVQDLFFELVAAR
jgi:putative sugar O-methyltransferase